MLLAILMPALNKVKKIAQRVVCGTNLRAWAPHKPSMPTTTMMSMPCRGRVCHPWQDRLVGFQSLTKDWSVVGNGKTLGCSLYLLVREADVSPKSFVCPGSDQTAYDGKNTNNLTSFNCGTLAMRLQQSGPDFQRTM